jgi:predicted transcriptional regulator
MRRMLFITVLAAALAAALSSGVFAIQAGTRAPDFSLSDQFGKQWTLSGLAGNVTVLVAADRNSGRSMGPWVDTLKNRYSGRIQILALMDLHDIPGIGRGIAKSRIRDETKDPVMIDFHGTIAKAYGVNSKYPVVVVIDKGSIVRAVQTGSYSDDTFRPISAAINTALGQALAK